MYDGLQTLTAIDNHRVGILALCALAMVFNYIWFFAAYVIAWREKVYSIPIFALSSGSPAMARLSLTTTPGSTRTTTGMSNCFGRHCCSP
jgi:hypothetical protein